MGNLTLTLSQKEQLSKLNDSNGSSYKFTPDVQFNGCTCQGNCDGRTSCGCQWG